MLVLHAMAITMAGHAARRWSNSTLQVCRAAERSLLGLRCRAGALEGERIDEADRRKEDYGVTGRLEPREGA